MLSSMPRLSKAFREYSADSPIVIAPDACARPLQLLAQIQSALKNTQERLRKIVEYRDDINAALKQLDTSTTEKEINANGPKPTT